MLQRITFSLMLMIFSSFICFSSESSDLKPISAIEIPSLAKKANQEVMDLFEKQNWQEIVDYTPKVKSLLRNTLLKAPIPAPNGISTDLNYNTFHAIGRALLEAERFLEGVEFFGFCQNYFPHAIRVSKQIEAIIYGWRGVHTYLFHMYSKAMVDYSEPTYRDDKEIDILKSVKEMFDNALTCDPEIDAFFVEFYDQISH